MRGRQRWVTLFLVLLMTWTPVCASHAQETADSFCLGMTCTVEEDMVTELVRTMDIPASEELYQSLKAGIALLNAAEVNIQFSLTGEQVRASLMMSDIEICYIQEDVHQGMRYVTTNFLPGIALTMPQSNVWEIVQALWRTNWADLWQLLKMDAEQWASSLAWQHEEGIFLGDVIPTASARSSYTLEDRDLAELVDAWIATLHTREDVAALVDTLFGDGYWNAWLALVEDYNQQVAWANQYSYDVSVLWDAAGQVVGTVILAGEPQPGEERPWQLTLGWKNQGVDMLVTLPQGAEDVLLRYTLSQSMQEGRHKLAQRMHLLGGDAGESYDIMAQQATEGILFEDEMNFHFADPLWEFSHWGGSSVQLQDMAFQMHQAGEGKLDMQTFSLENVTHTYLGADTLLATQRLNGWMGEAAAVPDFSQMQLVPLENLAYSEEVVNAFEEGINQLYVNLFKALPSECIDIIIEMTMDDF